MNYSWYLLLGIGISCLLQGLGNNTNDYQKLALILKDYGIPTVIAKVSRIDWLRNAAGLADANYWRGTLRPRPVLDWYATLLPLRAP